MKSVKPGRGPSALGAIAGIGVALFGVFWIIGAVSMGAWFMAPFGIIFVIIALSGAIYNYKNATGKERYSSFDIVDSDEEGDPLNRRFGKNNSVFDTSEAYSGKACYCAYCGQRLDGDFSYCPHCGRKVERK